MDVWRCGYAYPVTMDGMELRYNGFVTDRIVEDGVGLIVREMNYE
jgi:hypothetical protein